MKHSIFIFRRDLSLDDNLAFIKCYEESDKILPIFIFTPEQINKKKNPYFSSNCFQFMIECLESLDNELKTKYNSRLHFFIGDNEEILKKLLKEYNYQSIYFNIDYTKYAVERDEKINEFCNKNNIECITDETYLLNKLGTYLKIDGKEYLKFTPFKNFALTIKVPLPIKKIFKKIKFYKITNNFNLEKDLKKYYKKNPNLLLKGGRENAIEIMNNIKEFKDYDEIRNILIDNTTHLSAYIKFSCISIREIYHTILDKLGINNGLITQLYWREFYYYVGYYNRERLFTGHSLKEQYNKVKWGNDMTIFKKWCKGMTGFPIVDAGIREMNKTGYMHNRSRLITSNILIKILNIDWRYGEKYFAQTLIDYDPIVNNGNWQWSSSSGVDSQPFFRIFSVERQTENFDPDCIYIKKWIPELKDIPNEDIIKWNETYKKYPNIDYPKPCVNYQVMRKKILEVYKKGLYNK